MSISDVLHRKRVTPDAAAAAAPDHKEPAVYTDSSSDTASLEARNEKEVQQNPNAVTEGAQRGQQKAEAAALLYGKKTVWLIFLWIWVSFFMLALQSQVFFYTTALIYTSTGFSKAAQYQTTQIVANIVGAVVFLPLAKILNLWGRAEAFAIELFIYLLGMIISASANSPNAYAAGYVIYLIGFDTIYNNLQIFVADVSGLRKRAFAFAFVQTPFICTAFTGPLAAQAFLAQGNWRWSIGTFCIVQAVVLSPLVIVFRYYAVKAERLGLLPRKPSSGRTLAQSLVFYFFEFDIIGAIILLKAFIFFLLPFGLVSSALATYKSGTFIALFVIGVLDFFVFYAWERFGAAKLGKTFLRWELLQDRTVLGAVLTAVLVFMAFYSWDLNFYYFVSVVFDLSIANAGYMTQIYNVGSTFWAVIIGVWIYLVREFKYTTLCFSLPLLLLGTGLSIHFRGQDVRHIGYTVMCQILIAFGSSGALIGWDMAVMSAADRDGVPMVLSLIFTVTRLGGALGQAIGTAIFTATYLPALTEMLPGQPELVQTLFTGGSTLQQTYPLGSPERTAAIYAWSQVMYYGTIAATALLVPVFGTVAMWKHYRVDKKQNKGTVL